MSHCEWQCSTLAEGHQEFNRATTQLLGGAAGDPLPALLQHLPVPVPCPRAELLLLLRVRVGRASAGTRAPWGFTLQGAVVRRLNCSWALIPSIYLLLFLRSVACFLLLPPAFDFSARFDLLFGLCSELKPVGARQRSPSSPHPVSGQPVPLLQPETLPRMNLFSLTDHISCWCCEPGKKLEVRDVLGPGELQRDSRGVRWHVVTCTEGAGLAARLLSWPQSSRAVGV